MTQDAEIHDPLPPTVLSPCWTVRPKCSCGWVGHFVESEQRIKAEDLAKLELQEHIATNQPTNQERT